MSESGAALLCLQAKAARRGEDGAAGKALETYTAMLCRRCFRCARSD